MPTRPLLLLAVLLLACACAASAQGTPDSGTAGLAEALDHPGLRGARVGVLVVRAADGAPVFARQADKPLIPASNLKVLTTLAALESLGPTHRFTTRFRSDAPPDADGAVARLVVEGGGDPALTSERWWRIAADLRRAGVRTVRGDLVVDDRAFDAERWSPGWGEVSSRAYHAPIGALTANYGAFAVEVAPGAASGAPVSVTLDPPIGYLRIVNEARTGSPGSAATLSVGRSARAGHERIRVGGRLPAGAAPVVFYRSVADPGLYAGAVLRLQLEAVGIEVAGEVVRGMAPEARYEILAFEGPPLAEVVSLCLKYSNNAIAEMLLKQLGRERGSVAGSWASGREAVRASLGRLGLDASALTLVDGSGLARDNRVTPRHLVEALRRAKHSFAFGPELLAALPIAARDGTLEKRTSGSVDALRAKTGLLDGVTGLSGFARRGDGEELAFSILVNGARSDVAAMAAVDAFAAALVGGR